MAAQDVRRTTSSTTGATSSRRALKSRRGEMKMLNANALRGLQSVLDSNNAKMSGWTHPRTSPRTDPCMSGRRLRYPARPDPTHPLVMRYQASHLTVTVRPSGWLAILSRSSQLQLAALVPRASRNLLSQLVRANFRHVPIRKDQACFAF